MRSFFPLIFALVAITLFGLLEILLMRFLNKRWWQKKFIRRAAWGLPLFGVVMVVLWFVGEFYTLDWLAYPTAVLAVLAFILEFSLMLSLPLSGIVHLIQRIFDYFARHSHPHEEHKVNKGRRIVLQGAAAALPVITMASGAAGMTSAFSEVRVYLRKMKFPGLPKDLNGFRILHVSDLHLRHYVTLDTVSDILTRAADFTPDIILVTGDISDDLRLLPDTIKMFESFGAPFGAIATLGNHEYYRGVEKVKKIFGQHTMPLFINQGISLKVGQTSLFLGGIDDPRHMGAKDLSFFERTIGQTLEQSHGDDFRVLMSHRPDALDVAATSDIDLVLAGHTHGGQIGFMGRSVFEPIWPDRYLWGEYRRGDSQLYTSSGAGQWFPFRLNCPTEAPVIELSNG